MTKVNTILGEEKMGFTVRLHEYNKIPVLINFLAIEKKNINRLIREFLTIPTDTVETLLKDGNLVILIDDIIFSETTSSSIKKLEKFTKENSNVQLIVSSSLVVSSIIPTEYLEYNKTLNFNLVFIQAFNSKQIKQLISKWFYGKDIDLKKKMERLIKSFIDLGLAKTPLSITLFLLVFEKQDNKPINNAVLAELYIENILEKTNVKNVYSETFDFTNKKRLLSFAARYMCEKGNPKQSYSVDYTDLLKYIGGYLKKRFPGKPQVILDDFLRRKIFVLVDENRIKFKAAFQFHYFLALQLDYDPEFWEIVFKGNNYLNYVEEIIFYSGLKRDNLQLLKFTQEKLDELFSTFNDEIRAGKINVDSILNFTKREAITNFIPQDKLKVSEEKIDKYYDKSLSEAKEKSLKPKEPIHQKDYQTHADKILRLAALVLKNSEDVDDYKIKEAAFENLLISSMSYILMFRHFLISYYRKYQDTPQHIPKNIDLLSFIKILPLLNQMMLNTWLGSPKLQPTILDKIRIDKQTLNISNYEKFLSIFVYGDIRGKDYPKLIKEFTKKTKDVYLKDFSFLKIMAYLNLRTNNEDLDRLYIRLLTNIKIELGQLDKKKKSQFMKQIKENKKKGL